MSAAVCEIDGCDRPARTRGLCNAHYHRLRNHGDPLGGGPPAMKGSTPAERALARINKDGPVPDYAPHLGKCWLWTGSLDRLGYGPFQYFREDGKRVNTKAYRFLYQLLVGPIPDGLVLDHLCRVPACVNPAHLEPVTQEENVRRGISFSAVNAAKTHCPKGHEYTEANTYRVKGKWRECRICRADRCQAFKARHAA